MPEQINPKPIKVIEETPQELSDEDKQLKELLDLCVQRLQDPDESLYHQSLEILRTQIRASTTSMTSVPKPLKFMRIHYETLQRVFDKITDKNTKRLCADILSVLSMTMGENRECLKYNLLAAPVDIAQWGHEYVRHLAGEIAGEWNELPDYSPESEYIRHRLVALAEQIIPYNMAHNVEFEACDLLMEIEHLELLFKYVDENVYERVCLYLHSCVPYTISDDTDSNSTSLMKTILQLFLKFKQYPQALRVAIQYNDRKLIEQIFNECSDQLIKKQLAFILARNHIFIELPESTENYDDLMDIMSNAHLNHHFINLGRELDIMEPKTPEDVYKSHLDSFTSNYTSARSSPFGGVSGHIDSARQNLAASFVNGFVNAGFGQDKLLMTDGNKWLFKNKEHGMMSATASLGLILLWNVDGGLTPIDKYLYSSEDYIKSGALLACGIVNCGVRNECDPALALLSDYVLNEVPGVMRLGAILGLGLAYAGSNRQDVLTIIQQVFSDSKSTMEIIGVASIACGMIAVGSCNSDVTATITQTLMEKSEMDLKNTYARFLPLGLGLIHLGRQDKAVEALMAALEVIHEPFKSMATTLVEVCAFAGTGNVLKVQKLLHICSEHYESTSEENGSGAASTAYEKEKPSKEKMEKQQQEKEEKEHKDLSSKQAIAVLGIALISMGEDIGSEMAFRTFGHLLRYCEPVIRRSVPLALGLISISNPKLPILDTLSKFSHDSDPEVAHNAIFAMGLIGAGTNNACLAAMLRQLAQYHAKDPNNLFMVRLAQGLAHLGKGTLTLSPYHSDRQLLNPVAVAGILSTLIAFLDVKNIILGKSHYLLYSLVAAMQPRMLVTFDEDLNPLPVPVRVGMAVDIVGQAGRPKTITGFQTHTTPVLLGYGERAELATEEYAPLTPILEGFVILKKINPEIIVS
ncbi:26S proteasome non-ATPase regulatory subunit 2-like [Chrysoperla carnea]|uniref:26S proteasome non-ATPase regulatory subunit 2-like n=1 Tax=Chrysoperla carnea TaxID=189513 RepID=UPI001D081CBC|nr:26S proteasome non-ATPase regulatory subunit 2-like [Chrysoperla carnea]